MGFLDGLFGSNGDENIPAIMPDGAIDQIRRGITPNMRTDKILLSKGEICHFAERAILVTEKTKRHYEGRNNGYSIRLTKRITYRTGKSKGVPVDDVIIEKTKGLIYVTDKRVIFVSDKNAFDKKIKSLTACVPYSNAVKLQFGSSTYTLMVPDGGALSAVISLLGNNLN